MDVCGGALIRGQRMYLEAALGSAPTLFRYGRVGVRRLYDGEVLIEAQRFEQDIASVFNSGRLRTISPSQKHHEILYPAIERVWRELQPLQEGVVEWGTCERTVFCFDFKPETGRGSSYKGLDVARPEIPLVVKGQRLDSVDEMRVEYPELARLREAVAAGAVTARKGALLSHLALYSIDLDYDCRFLS